MRRRGRGADAPDADVPTNPADLIVGADAQRVATLARLRLTPAEATRYAAQLYRVLADARSLSGNGEPDVVAAQEVPADPPVLRRDVPHADPLAAPLTSIAPALVAGFLVVPLLEAQRARGTPGA